jgi:hypothetical protein
MLKSDIQLIILMVWYQARDILVNRNYVIFCFQMLTLYDLAILLQSYIALLCSYLTNEYCRMVMLDRCVLVTPFLCSSFALSVLQFPLSWCPVRSTLQFWIHGSPTYIGSAGCSHGTNYMCRCEALGKWFDVCQFGGVLITSCVFPA